MDLATKTHQLGPGQIAHPFMSSGPSSPSFPIIGIAIIGILATALLLVSYYVFVIDCRRRIDVLGRFSLSRHNDADVGGLEESDIRSIPVFRYRKQRSGGGECAVCLGEYREGDNLRLIPDCLHSFHVDCIDVWLLASASCPLCRSSVSPAPPPIRRAVIGRKMSMGDDCIIAGRDKDEMFSVEPIRRSFSMDSSRDRMAIQEALRRQCGDGVVSPDQNARSLRTSFFSFGNGSRGASRTTSAILPVYLEP